jgi:hypothetical protein
MRCPARHERSRQLGEQNRCQATATNGSPHSTHTEVGIVGRAIGFATGTAVLLRAARRMGVDLQAVAIRCALLGILLGKYLGFAFVIQETAELIGFEPGLFSGDMIDLFRESIGDVFRAFDLL